MQIEIGKCREQLQAHHGAQKENFTFDVLCNFPIIIYTSTKINMKIVQKQEDIRGKTISQ